MKELNSLVGSSQVVEPYYRVRVDVKQQSILAYGKTELLRPGMLVDADILGEHRKLYEWILEPLYSLSGRL